MYSRTVSEKLICNKKNVNLLLCESNNGIKKYRLNFNGENNPEVSKEAQGELDSMYDDAVVFRNNEYNQNDIKDKEKKLISGDPEKIKTVYDTWVFAKDSNPSNQNWLLIDTIT